MFNSTVGNSSLCWSMTLHTFEVPVPTAQFVIFFGFAWVFQYSIFTKTDISLDIAPYILSWYWLDYMEISPQHTYLRHLFHLCAIVLSTSISPTEGAYHWDYLITWSIRRRVSEKSFVICPKRVLFRLVVMEIRWRDRNMNERVCKINTASVRSSPDNKLPSDSASDWVIGAGRLFSRFSIVELQYHRIQLIIWVRHLSFSY